MSTRRPRARLLLAAGVVAVLLASALSACTSSGGDGHRHRHPHRTAHQAARAIDRALDARAAVVRRADARDFDRLLGGPAAFRDQQDMWFANVVQLPVGRLGYRLDRRSVVRDGDAYWAVVVESLRLEGYDATPVVTRDRWRFVPAGHHPGRLLLVSVSDPRWEREHDVREQPWELEPLDVREGTGVLGIFDDGSVAAAPGLLASLESGIASVSAEVPYDWSRSAVVYALSDPAFLDSLEDVPGDDPDALDAVAFPVGRSTRFVLNPRMLQHSGRERDRLLRHELTHVAIGRHDDGAPVWLSEGLAEYVAVRPLAPRDRRIPAAAVAAAEHGVSDLPDDASFNDQDSGAHYGIAWWAVEYVADAYGRSAPWQLLDAMTRPHADPDEVLRDQFGTSTHELARQAARLILSLYDPGTGTQ